MKSSKVGPEERVSENSDLGGTDPEVVARKRACRESLDSLRAMFIETSVCSGLPMTRLNERSLPSRGGNSFQSY